MASQPETDADAPGPSLPDDSHRLQAAAIWRRWRTRPEQRNGAADRAAIPGDIPLPAEAWRHYRHFSWVLFEQRLLVLALGSVLAAGSMVWGTAIRLHERPPVVVRAESSLKEAATAYYGTPGVSYNQLAFFLNACLPLLYAIDGAGHPLLPLAQGLVAPEIYDAAEARLDKSAKDVRAHAMMQALAITAITGVVADLESGRAAATVRGYLTVTARGVEARFFPWRARVLVEANPPSRLNPYPFYVLRSEERIGPAAPSWDEPPGT
jgi:hypothetical protein